MLHGLVVGYTHTHTHTHTHIRGVKVWETSEASTPSLLLCSITPYQNQNIIAYLETLFMFYIIVFPLLVMIPMMTSMLKKRMMTNTTMKETYFFDLTTTSSYVASK